VRTGPFRAAEKKERDVPAQVGGAAEGAVLKEGTAFALEGFHLEFLLAEVPVDVSPVPDETAFAFPIEGHPEGKNAAEG